MTITIPYYVLIKLLDLIKVFTITVVDQAEDSRLRQFKENTPTYNYPVAFSSEPHQPLMKGVKRVGLRNCRNNKTGIQQYHVCHIHLNSQAGASCTALVVTDKNILQIFPKSIFPKIFEEQKCTSTELKNYDKSVCQNTVNDNIINKSNSVKDVKKRPVLIYLYYNIIPFASDSCEGISKMMNTASIP